MATQAAHDHEHDHEHGGHNHGHAHGSGHTHGGGATNLRWAFLLNITFTVIEFIGGWWTNSVAVLSDAFHDLGDALVLGTAWYLSSLARKGRDGRYSYGYGRYNMLGGWLTALVLIVGAVAMVVFTIPRLLEPVVPRTEGMMILAVFGLAMNGFAAWKLHGGGSLNERGAYLHLLEDVLGWAAVLIGALVMHWTGWGIIDPLLALAIAVFIAYNAFATLRAGTRILMQHVPEGFDEEATRRALLTLPNVIEVHDAHAWTLDGSYLIYTVHLAVSSSAAQDHARIRTQARDLLTAQGVHHATIELEMESEPCGLRHH